MAELTVLVPTRGRVKSAIRLFQAFKATSTADTELIFVITADDPAHDDYYWALTQAGSRAITVHPKSPGFAPPLNAAFEALKASLGFAVAFMGDDHLPRTAGWDSELLSDLKKLKTGVAYGNDLLQGESLPTAVAMTTDIPRTLGFMVPPTILHFYADNVWLDWGKGLDKVAYRDDVVIEHLHPVAGKASEDDSYALSRPLEEKDQAAYSSYREKSLSDDLKALRELVEEPVEEVIAAFDKGEKHVTQKPAPKKRAPRKAAPAKKAGA